MAPGQPRGFGFRHVRRVDKGPPLVEAGMIEEPFDRPRIRPRKAVLDFFHLFGCMDVDGTAARERDDVRQFGWRYGAQTVGRNP